MSIVIQIKDREAIPVRAIPFLTCWQTMTPDALALALSGDEHFYCFESVLAHRAIGGEALQQKWWQSNVVRPLRALSDKLKATETTHETGLQDFHSESLKMLPAGVYVWRDEFEQAHQRHYSGIAVPVDCDGNVITLTDSEVAKLTAAHQERISLDFHPFIPDVETQHIVMEGFEQYRIALQTAPDGAPWWQTKHNVFEMAQNIGSRLNSQGKRASNAAIAKEIESSINGIEHNKATGRTAPNWDTIRGHLTNWQWKPE